MDPKEQGNALARRREQNRLAQRRFRWKKGQHRDTARGQESRQRQKQNQNQSTRASEGQQIDTPPTSRYQLRTLRPTTTPRPEPFNLLTPTPSPSIDETTDPIPSPDPFHHLPSGKGTNNNSPPSPSRPKTPYIPTTTGTHSRKDLALSLASGMGGLLGDHGAACDFTDLDASSPPPQSPRFTSSEGYPGDGLMTASVIIDNIAAAAAVATMARSVFVPPPLYQDPLENNNSLLTPIPGSSSLERGPSEQQQRPATATPIDDGMEGASLPYNNNHWLPPLHLAAYKGHGRIVRMLLQHHHPINDPDSHGQTALMHAVQGGFDDIVRSLLDSGATVDRVDERGRTALHWAVLGRRGLLLRGLLEKLKGSLEGGEGGDDLDGGEEEDQQRVVGVDVYDDEGMTALHKAIYSGFEEGVGVLLEFGASLACRARVMRKEGVGEEGSGRFAT